MDTLQVPVAGHISVEKSEEARKVVEANSPDGLQVDDIASVDEEMVKSWCSKFLP